LDVDMFSFKWYFFLMRVYTMDSNLCFATDINLILSVTSYNNWKGNSISNPCRNNESKFPNPRTGQNLRRYLIYPNDSNYQYVIWSKISIRWLLNRVIFGLKYVPPNHEWRFDLTRRVRFKHCQLEVTEREYQTVPRQDQILYRLTPLLRHR